MTLITIIAPVLNEIDHVEGLIDDIVAQDFDGDIEIFIADGGSTDGSRDRLTALAYRHGMNLTVIDNPRRFVAPGLNACILMAKGDLIVRLDCHSRYPSDYVRRCVDASDATGAWNVGGIYEPSGRSWFERAVACALASPFGGVNWTRQGGSRREVDTVYLGAFRPEVFEKAGLYDESLVRNQDDELNLRIHLAGGKIVFDPLIRSVYTPRGSLRAVWRQYREYGYWKVIVMRKHRRPAGARSFAPAVFVFALACLGGLATVSTTARKLLVACLAVYVFGAGFFAIRATRRSGESATVAPFVASVFPAFHVGYGVGMLQAVIGFAFPALTERAKRAEKESDSDR